VDSLQSGHGPAREAGYGVGHQGAADDREEECGGRASPEGPLGSAWAGGAHAHAHVGTNTNWRCTHPHMHHHSLLKMRESTDDTNTRVRAEAKIDI